MLSEKRGALEDRTRSRNATGRGKRVDRFVVWELLLVGRDEKNWLR